jgi:hypothetical protein
MPKRVDPTPPFQPIEKAFLSAVIDDEDELAPAPTQSRPKEPAARRRRSEARDRAMATPQPVRERVIDMPRRDSVAESEERGEPEESAAMGSERFTRVLKAKITSSEEVKLSDIVTSLKRELDTPVSTTHVVRALVTIRRHSEKAVVKRARENGPLRRPSNEDHAAIAVFEHRLAKLLMAAFRDAPPLRELPRE